MEHRRVIGLDDRPQLVLDITLVPDQPLPVTSQRSKLGKQR
jgi:hypothetical protein